jgi:hypothetical protein
MQRGTTPLPQPRRCGTRLPETTTRDGSTPVDAKTLLILILLVAVGVLGYLYYDARQHSVSVDLPNLKIEAK